MSEPRLHDGPFRCHAELAGVPAASLLEIQRRGGIGSDCDRRPFDREDARAREVIELLLDKLEATWSWPRPRRTLEAPRRERQVLLDDEERAHGR